MNTCDVATALLTVNLWVWYFLGVASGAVLWCAFAWVVFKYSRGLVAYWMDLSKSIEP